MFLVALISSFLDLISKQAGRNAAVSVLLLKKNDIFYPIFQPRPQALQVPWPTSYKAREKRPGDEVADLQQNSSSIFALLWVDTNTLLID